jgi:CTP:molybdopterin cytidylyltransferase MocA
MHHAEGESPLERLVDAARAATVRDTAQRALQAGFERVVVMATDGLAFVGLDAVEVDIDPVRRPFGARLKTFLTRHAPEGLCYAGSGMPLMTAGNWRGLRDRIAAGETVANNLYSSDVLATPATADLSSIPDELSDNGLALYLRDEAEIDVAVLPRSAAALLDIDTPADLTVLALCREVPHFTIGGALAAVLSVGLSAAVGAGLPTPDPPMASGPSRLDTATGLLTQRGTDVLVIGRVGSAVWQALESETATRVRVVSEERGLRSRPDGRARSLLGFHLGAVGPGQLVEALAELGDAVFLDTRPLFAHLQWQPSRADRFASDAGDWESIEHAELRAFTRAAVESRVPFVLGGHSLVSGGLLALIDAAWARWEVAQGDSARDDD